jgi:glycosyltransferase involved in cell wall biosynthesis
VENKLVSIGIPTYNRPEGLIRAIECFVNQSHKNIEIIIADNHSEFNSLELIKSKFNNDSRIHFHRHEKNHGMAFNSEFVWNSSTGDYFLLGSDDDWWHRDFISECLHKMKISNTKIALSNFYEADWDGNKITSLSKFNSIKKLMGLNTHAFPDHIPLLKNLSCSEITQRIINFIESKESDGKANIHRALCDRRLFLESVTELKEANINYCWGYDQLLAFLLIMNSKLAYTDKVLFKCTVQNSKNYIDNGDRVAYLDGYRKLIDLCELDVDKEQIIKSLDRKFINKKLLFFFHFKKKILNYCASSPWHKVKIIMFLLVNKRYSDASILINNSSEISRFNFIKYIFLSVFFTFFLNFYAKQDEVS